MEFEHVLVVGAGQMGGGIAQVVAASGRRVSLHDAFPGAVERGLADDAKRASRSSRAADVADEVSRITPVDELVAADLLIEAIIEDKDAKEEVFRRADEALPGARDPRLEHVLDPDHLARRGHRSARPRDRHALLQPGADAEARRGRARARDLRRDGGGDRRARGGAREDAGGRQRLSRLRLEPDPDAVHQRGGLGAARRRRRGGGDRHDREARLRASAGAARARRPDRARHVRRDHGGAAEGLGDPKYAPCPLLREHVAAGRLGRKSGQGFYAYG